jgi:hypothetical protein
MDEVKHTLARGLIHLMGFSKGGRISPLPPLKRGGKIRKGSPAMKRKMARLRAMRK